MSKIHNKIEVLLLALGLIVLNFTSIAQTKEQDNLQIIGGKAISIEQAPWQVALFRYDEQEGITSQFCGGTIIDEFWILTAAHCLEGVNPNEIVVVASSTTLSKAQQYGQVMAVAEIIIHPEYNDSPIQNDIAMIRLQNPINLTIPTAKAVPLITKIDEQNGLINPGIIGKISGWGSLVYQGNGPDSLNSVDIPIIHNDTANKWFEETGASETLDGWKVTDEMIAMGKAEGGISGCHGDSGGPFVVKNAEDKWAIAGITSWGAICGDPKMASVYTRVPYYEEYIRNITKIGSGEKPIYDDYVEILKYQGAVKLSSCNNEFNIGKLLIRNYGKNPLNNFRMKVMIQDSMGNEIYSKESIYNFNSPVPSGGCRNIDFLDTAISNLGKYKITIIADKANGNEAIGINPSIYYFEFQIINPTILKIKLHITEVSDATILTLYRSSTNIPLELINYSNSDKNKTFDYTYCLNDDDYYIQLGGDGSGKIDYIVNIENELGSFILSERKDFATWDYISFSVPFIPSVDAFVSIGENILDTSFVCDLNNTDFIRYTIGNSGTLPITNLNMTFNINGIITDTIIKEYIISYSSFSFPLKNTIFKNLEQNNISIKVNSFDSQIGGDANPQNNSGNISTYIEQIQTFGKLEIYASDAWPRYKWKIVDSKNNIILSGDAANGANKFTEELCIPEGCYYLITDDYFDMGIPANVGAIIFDNAGKPILTVAGANFKDGNKFEFCSFGNSVIDENLMKQFNIYPNPSNGSFKIDIQIAENEFAVVEISNILGEIVYFDEVNLNAGLNSLQINENNLSNGVYNVVVRLNNRFVTKQIVIQN